VEVGENDPVTNRFRGTLSVREGRVQYAGRGTAEFTYHEGGGRHVLVGHLTPGTGGEASNRVRQYLTAALRSPLRHILVAANGKEALEIVGATDLDLALLDLLMPGMTGVATFAQLRRIQPELPVIILTAYPDSDLVARGLEVGPFTLVNKAVGLSQIERAVEVILGRRSR
jgi:CheY-like chemotaxis protein